MLYWFSHAPNTLITTIYFGTLNNQFFPFLHVQKQSNLKKHYCFFVMFFYHPCGFSKIHDIKAIIIKYQGRVCHSLATAEVDIYYIFEFFNLFTYPLSWCNLSLLYFNGVNSVLRQCSASIGRFSSKNSRNFCSNKQNLIF
jgi:hypothetical protein